MEWTYSLHMRVAGGRILLKVLQIGQLVFTGAQWRSTLWVTTMLLTVLARPCGCLLVAHVWVSLFPSMRWLTRKCSEARVKSWASFELNDPHFKEHREVKTLLRNHVHSLSTSRLSYTKDIFAECAWKEEIIFVGKNYKGSVMFNKLQHTCNPNNDRNNYFLMDNFIAHRWHFKPRRSDSLYTLKLQR